ncbi:MAG TPA: hypothetical protein VFS52_20955 [Steroidobacteraceae bacterium]|jgi:hypothetical protein|nr:hypothetical protein [Steroidobacteraceae bacterium]
MNGISSAWEKLQGATLSLARSGPLKDRLTDAYRNHLSHIAEADLPKELRDDFRILTDAMTREPPLVRGDDAFRATVRKMSTEQAEEVASWVVRLLCATPRPAAAHRERVTQSAQILPLYISEARAAEG